MHGRWILFVLEVKKFIRMLPVILAETVLAAVILAGIGFCASKALYSERAADRIQVGVVSEGEDKMTEMLIRFASSMDSLRDVVSFARLSESEAKEQLLSGEIIGAVLIPEGLVDSILSGENIPVVILMDPSLGRVEAAVFAQAADAGAKLLSTAQAGIYGADAFCRAQKREDLIAQSEKYLNDTYIDYAMGRTSLLKEREVNALKGVNVTDYYGISLLLAFLSFTGLSFGKYMQVGCGERERMLKVWGIGAWQRYLIETMAFAAVFCFLGMLFGVPFFLLFIKMPESSFVPVAGWFWMAVIWVAQGCFFRMLAELFGNHSGGMGLCFLVLMAIMTVSGVFIPSAFLPAWTLGIARYLPFKGWMDALAGILQGRPEAVQIGKVMFMTFFYLTAGILLAAGRACLGAHPFFWEGGLKDGEKRKGM